MRNQIDTIIKTAAETSFVVGITMLPTHMRFAECVLVIFAILALIDVFYKKIVANMNIVEIFRDYFPSWGFGFLFHSLTLGFTSGMPMAIAGYGVTGVVFIMAYLVTYLYVKAINQDK
ncbi:hypothetical protein AB4455_04935 [Vibrio sp. 10N.261.46.E12]|uniref:hypothetical protein n=1 Tax=unclassified Vibrio TaxID=2614977 RepID=UPI0009769503|nr:MULTISPECIES: hypothetical protein [unclassified Vibrio]OMO36204.1 hypothetical protein BH584_05355 [Vibrio sp. 10N.261.45.E1]PMJ34444.1 hypothetical protein BCU27_03180 [Vibrio sp. 10N.286.45.B6]PML86815.1 hypothetical protein BCT66_00885 [Vibrio sp. 10N.261.49.E11]PMM76815.1 hypothetical protein BCT48_24760 [Vibrio sp. 10N.261.46.F12]PMM81817.1 hypothetical protein BCT46_15535 [Vibrio sp. 10N.261.46.E8]